MTKTLLIAGIAAVSLGFATAASAQASANPNGMDLGIFHSLLASPIPTQITTYYPPPAAVVQRRHRQAPTRPRIARRAMRPGTAGAPMARGQAAPGTTGRDS